MRLLLLVGATSCRRRRNATWGRDPLNPCSGPLVAPIRSDPGPSSAHPRLFSSLCCSLVSHPPRRSPPFHPLSVALSLSLSFLRSRPLDSRSSNGPKRLPFLSALHIFLPLLSRLLLSLSLVIFPPSTSPV